MESSVSWWSEFLARWTREIAARASENPNERRAIDPVLGLGAPGASEAQLAAAETRLGAQLPPSYRDFLRATNGLSQPFAYVATTGGDLWPAEELAWFRDRNAEWIDAYLEFGPSGVSESEHRLYGAAQDPVRFRAEHLAHALELSHDGDSGVYLLDPLVIDDAGEWEAWHFANWIPGAVRYRSFRELMEARYAAFRSGSNEGF